MSTVQPLLLIFKLAEMLEVDIDDTKDTVTHDELCRVLQAAIKEVSGDAPKRRMEDSWTEAYNRMRQELELMIDKKLIAAGQGQTIPNSHQHGWYTGPQWTYTSSAGSAIKNGSFTTNSTDALSSITTA